MDETDLDSLCDRLLAGGADAVSAEAELLAAGLTPREIAELRLRATLVRQRAAAHDAAVSADCDRQLTTLAIIVGSAIGLAMAFLMARCYYG